ncbi:hypothetical protein BSKO_10861 [Bryopsis sp. KO-2023]|nr:hypothetical protein BSKO_10861 [Bryopsis sp. KO-2023]
MSLNLPHLLHHLLPLLLLYLQHQFLQGQRQRCQVPKLSELEPMPQQRPLVLLFLQALWRNLQNQLQLKIRRSLPEEKPEAPVEQPEETPEKPVYMPDLLTDMAISAAKSAGVLVIVIGGEEPVESTVSDQFVTFASTTASAYTKEGTVAAESFCVGDSSSVTEGATTVVGNACGGVKQLEACRGVGASCCARSFKRRLCNYSKDGCKNGPWIRNNDYSSEKNTKRSFQDGKKNQCFCLQ